MKKTTKSKKKSSKKPQWKTPKLIVLSDAEFQPGSSSHSVYAAYTGGGGTAYHSTDIQDSSVSYVCN